MYFSEENIKQLEDAYAEVEGKYQSLLLTFAMRAYKQKEAAEFAMHGFTRRIKTMKRCIDNIYRICPPNIDRKPSSEELSDLAINLQAFVLNVYGSLDNLAWVWVKEKGILNKKGNPLSNGEIGFAEKYSAVRDTFSPEFQAYLKTLNKWFAHVENFRHSLAHRIPLYVPPYVSNEEEVKREKELEELRTDALKKHQFEEFERLSDEIETLGKFVPWMTHSFGEKSPQAVFHAQIIADWNTVVQISENFLEELNK
ncbi:MAG: hypothetical protein Q8K65_11300 [Alphaproteobacteria bacterium]|nr:hypothetical protein [Alphaproteobacteria bacterium]